MFTREKGYTERGEEVIDLGGTVATIYEPFFTYARRR